MSGLFGTDGVRGTANIYPMTAETVLRLAMASAAVMRRGDHLHRVLIGKDTRLSGYMLEQALTAGFLSTGMDVILVGPVPTPAIAILTRALRCDLGVMVSASHNPYQDNGIKLFGPDGYKISHQAETAIETMVLANEPMRLAPSDNLGKASRLDDAKGRYIEVVKSSFPKGMTLDGLKIVLDCANGAAWRVAPQVLWELGADVVRINAEPNGKNINDCCGATAPQSMQAAVIQHQAHLGISLDGDADRIIMADEKGMVIDGDQIMGLIASFWHQKGKLRGGGIAATVMSNMGLEQFIQQQGLDFDRTAVGDRHVVERMRYKGYNLGGEQSGHIVLDDYTTTGDGIIAALQVMAVIQQRGVAASEICRVFTPFPQIMRNYRIQSAGFLEKPAIQAVIRDAEQQLHGRGRLLVRKSGTEPLIRVMAEADDEIFINQLLDNISEVINAHLSPDYSLELPLAQAV
ncbi:MAG: phosphoglucosamine mutase [Alphaproteobacteria bacterium]